MNRIHVILPWAMLVAVAVPAGAEGVVTNVSITSTPLQGNCPARVYIAQGVIEANGPTSVAYTWQWALWPSSDTNGNHGVTNYPMFSYRFDRAGSLKVTSPPW